MSNKGIFFDEHYTYSILQVGYTEGYVKPYSVPKVIEGTYSQRVLSMGAQPETRKAALQMLLIHDSCHLSPFDNFTIEGLEQEGLATVSESGIRFLTLEPENIVQAKAFAPFIWMDLQARGYHYTYEEVIQKISYEAEEHRKLFYEWLQRGGGRAGEICAILAEKEGDLELAQKFRRQYLGSAQRIEQEIKQIDEKLKSFQPIVDAYWHVNYLFKQSETLKVPTLTKIIPRGQLSKERLANTLRAIKEDEMVVATLFFDNLEYLEVDSIREVIKYRKRNEISEFRAQINECIEGLRKGKIDLYRIKKRIDKANEASRKIGRASKVGAYTTALSLPAGICSYLLCVPAGFALTLIGLGAIGYSEFLKHHYKWSFIKR